MKLFFKKIVPVMMTVTVLICAFSFSVSAGSTFVYDFDVYSNSFVEVYPYTPTASTNSTPVVGWSSDSGGNLFYRMAIYPKNWNSNTYYVGGINSILNFDLFSDESGRAPYIIRSGNQYDFALDLEFWYKASNSEGWVNLPHGGSFATVVITFASNWESDIDYKFYYLNIPFEELYDNAEYHTFEFSVDGDEFDGYAINLVELQWRTNVHLQALETRWFNFSIDKVSSEEAAANKITGEILQSREEVNKKIEESTDKITNGWSPDPVAPEGSESVDELTDIENQLDSGIQDSVSQGQSLISNIGSMIGDFSAGLIFILGLFNLSFNVGWLTSLLQISLAIGIISFLLNFIPSASVRYQNRRDAEQRRSEYRKRGKGG